MEFIVPPETRDVVLKLGVKEDIPLPTELKFVPYQPGLREKVSIAALFDESHDGGPDLAFLKYEPGAYVPGHVHMGFELVLVIQGDYIENGQIFTPGSLVLRAPGTCHSMSSKGGCVILASRYRPVKQLIEDFRG
ncbi:cupin domain-containing protein [Vibrio cholerae]